ncbi:hypothetical protein ONE63_011121 [Megalurothrips usitatus]|uniref:C2H2-type domain-containing protein n=1 Tax=Megalurothrips usitatus TaxID=439358 RepID=A0AAV7XF37_9NEOP|nr:hypothetical protein ONE63_011121 [Megalurothrips usitatus]
MFVCSVCEETQASINDLSTHLFFFHQRLQSDKFLCYYCKNTFSSIFAFKRHLAKRHSQGGPVVNEVNHVPHAEHVAVEVEVDDPEPVLIDDLNDNDRFTLNYFVENLYSDAQLYIAQLYSLPNVSRKLVDEVVCGTSELLANSVRNLRDNVFSFISTFNDLPENYANDIVKLQYMFDTLENPFEYMNSEHKRFQALSSSGCYIPPVKFEMGHVDAYEKSPDGTLVLVQKPVYSQMVPLRHVLKKFLELPGMLDNINEYVNALHDGKIMNFVQGELWSDLRVKPNDKGNKPPTTNLTLGCLQNCSWNLYASEMLCCTRYLGEIVGDLVPEKNRVWKLYLIIREIVDIVTAPYFQDGVDIYLGALVQEHHELYLLFFGTLKPKHHFMTHMAGLMKRNGPLILCSSLMCERNHRKGKLYGKACNSRVNWPFSVAVKYQLSLCERLMRKDDHCSRLIATSGVSQICVQNLVNNYHDIADFLPYDILRCCNCSKDFCYFWNIILYQFCVSYGGW